jgi:hypothetical protein
MYLALGILCIGFALVAFWIAFHDIQSLLGTDKPTVQNIFGMVFSQGGA